MTTLTILGKLVTLIFKVDKRPILAIALQNYATTLATVSSIGTTILLDAVGLDAGGTWTVERTGYKPYTMEITGNNGEAGRYAVRFESITVGDGFGKEHHGTAHFDVKRNEQRYNLFIEGKISSIHRDKSEHYPLRLLRLCA